jgi:hypothetical protein
VIICALFAASLRKRQADKLPQQMKPIELHDFSRQGAIACGLHYHQANVRKMPRVRAARAISFCPIGITSSASALD